MAKQSRIHKLPTGTLAAAPAPAPQTPVQAPATPTVPLLALPAPPVVAGNPAQVLASMASQLAQAAAPALAAAPAVPVPAVVIAGSSYNVPRNTYATNFAANKAPKPLAQPTAVVVLGKPYSSRAAHNAAMWQAVAAAVAAGQGKATQQALCSALAAAGVPRGAAFVQYAMRSGWLVPATA